MASQSEKPVQQVDTAVLSNTLREQGAVLEYRPSVITSSFFEQLWRKYPPAPSGRAQTPF